MNRPKFSEDNGRESKRSSQQLTHGMWDVTWVRGWCQPGGKEGGWVFRHKAATVILDPVIAFIRLPHVLKNFRLFDLVGEVLCDGCPLSANTVFLCCPLASRSAPEWSLSLSWTLPSLSHSPVPNLMVASHAAIRSVVAPPS